MKPLQPQTQEKTKSEVDRRRHQLQIAKGVFGLGQGLAHGNAEQTLVRAMSLGTKLASSPFYDAKANIITLLKELKAMGAEVLLKTPETLFAYIDKRIGNKTEKEAADAIEHFHETGLLLTDVPPLVRNKIYAIRTASMSDAPYEEWNIFEKVGGAFNGRVANFSHLEPMSSGECAVTVALLDAIRPDTFSNEVKIYIAACCHQDGLLTVKPVEYLSIAEEYLQQFNEETSGRKADLSSVEGIKIEFDKLKSGEVSGSSDESVEHIQAGKLLGAYLMAQEAIQGNH